jgi:hypothetical protein
MTDQEPTPHYGSNFENHPILSKLSTFDRIAFSAEMASEINLVYAKGFNAALVNMGELIKQVSQRGEGDFSPNTQAVLAMVWDMVNMTNEKFLNLYENQDYNE